MTEVVTPSAAKLKPIQQQFRQPLTKLLLLRLLSFAFQLTCFWLFAAMMHEIIVMQRAIELSAINLFAVFAIGWVLFKFKANSYEQTLTSIVESYLVNQLNSKLASQQHALAKQHASHTWQQIYLEHIPAIGEFVSQYLSQKFLSVLLPLMVLILLIPVNWLVSMVLLFTLPLVPLFMVLVGHRAANLHRQHFVSLERLGSLFIDRLKALTLLTSFNQHYSQSQLLQQASQVVNRQTMKVVSIAFLSTTVLDFFSTIAVALVAVYIGFTLLGELSFGPELSFQYGLFLLLVAPLLFSELKSLGRLYHHKAKAEAAIDVLEPILVSPDIWMKKADFSGFQWINFYLEQPKLHATELSLNLHDAVLLTGSSGAGKSALFEALMGLRDASHHLQVKCTYMGQKPVVLPGSVRDNLCVNNKFSDAKLWEVLGNVELSKTISDLPFGLDTELGEYPPLSGGELQRLSLARALLQDAEFLMLDEPTAHLTLEQHVLLSELIYKLCKERTLIWASHKALPKAWFNHQWRIENGQILCR